MTTPYRFDTLPLGAGILGIGPLPGRDGDLAGAVAAIRDFAPALVITLTESAEMAALGARDLPDALAATGIDWAHFPVGDYGVPDPAVAPRWPAIAEAAHRALAAGGRVFVHCRGGLGRSGMVALRLMVEAGESPEVALERLRRARPGTVETAAQEGWATAPATRSPAP